MYVYIYIYICGVFRLVLYIYNALGKSKNTPSINFSFCKASDILSTMTVSAMLVVIFSEKTN